MKNKLFFLCVFTFVCLCFSACSSPNPVLVNEDISPPPEVTVTPMPVENTEKEPSQPLDPNFVLPDFSSRPICVMIDNEGIKPLPQGGLNKAQLIYEMVAEGGTTRLMPVFWNTDPSMIGPVRSARDYFIDYSLEHDAIYVHFGGSPEAYKDIKRLNLNDIDGTKGRDGGIFWDITDEGSRNWQDSYTNMEKVRNHITKLKFRTSTDKEPVFSYNTQDTDLVDSKNATKIKIKYTTDYWCSFTYDAESKNYLRFRKDNLHMERTTDQQLTAKNIIIQRVQNSSIAGDDKGRQALNNLGKGSGWYISNGKAIKIKWSKTSMKEGTKYTDEKGQPISLNQGSTWIQIVPLSSLVSVE